MSVLQFCMMLLGILWLVLALLFIVRVICALFSIKLRNEMRARPVFHYLWGAFFLAYLLAFLGILDRGFWTSKEARRRDQLKVFAARVQEAGGWNLIRQDCVALAQQYTNGYSYPWQTNEVPKSFLALKPYEFDYYPTNQCVRFHIAGILMGREGRMGSYFAVEVFVATNGFDYKSRLGIDNGKTNRVGQLTTNQVADGIYEIYHQ